MAITAVQAAEIHLDDDKLVVSGVDDSLGIGAFDVVLTYDSDVTIDSVEGLSGFMVAANIKNEEGTTIIAGISTQGMTGTISVATVGRSGTGAVDVTVRSLANTKGDPIVIVNPEFSGDMPIQAPTSSGGPTTGATSTTTSRPSEVTPAPTAESDLDPGQSEVPTVSETAITSGTPLTPGSTDVAARTESAPPNTPKAGFGPVIAAISLLAVIVLKRKPY